MLKEIIKKCAIFMNRNDIVSALDENSRIEEFTDEEIKHDVLRLLWNFNTITSTIFENYLDLVYCEKIASDSFGRISFEKFSKNPVKVVRIQDENNCNISFSTSALSVITKHPKSLFNVTYCYVPKKVFDLTDDIGVIPSEYENTICCGMISEFLCSISKYAESAFWKEKFLTNLFNLKIKKDRRVKSTYCV